MRSAKAMTSAISLRVLAEEKAVIEKAARDSRMSLSNFIRRLVMMIDQEPSAWELSWPGSEIKSVTNNLTLKEAWERGYAGEGAIIRPLVPTK